MLSSVVALARRAGWEAMLAAAEARTVRGIDVRLCRPFTPERERVWAVTESMLALLDAHAPRVLRRAATHARALAVMETAAGLGGWLRAPRLIVLSVDDVRDPVSLAALFTHHVSTACLERRGMRYAAADRPRFAAACWRATSAALARIPGGETIAEAYRAAAASVATLDPQVWSDAADSARTRAALANYAAAMGLPDGAGEGLWRAYRAGLA